MSREDLLGLLDDIRERVAAGDSFEGKLQYLLGTSADKPYEAAARTVSGEYRVYASYAPDGASNAA